MAISDMSCGGVIGVEASHPKQRLPFSLVGVGFGEPSRARVAVASDVHCPCRRIFLRKPINIDCHAVAGVTAVRGSGNVSLQNLNKTGDPIRFLRRTG